jgi:hypothetical protein
MIDFMALVSLTIFAMDEIFHSNNALELEVAHLPYRLQSGKLFPGKLSSKTQALFNRYGGKNLATRA